ncbi:hypothetical protein Glove_242g37 [Diversispora epigaea]|uniref:Amino acid transporter transmembrane domain-containing protein n=1 Tax=Diversispora epigaea TaxID=1348612 RepID=A0A397IGJ6_9GLOM|nr:hypothetical protein Glove_242g37 [Diversispora epigaea]
MEKPNSISFFGSVALLVSSMTGPGLVTIPLLFQQAGWFIPIIIFVIALLLSGSASLFLCEALSTIPGNNRFQDKIEFSRLTSILIKKKHHRLIVQLTLYIAIQSFIISSIIISSQTMDSLMISLAGKTCGIGIHPTTGFFCVREQGLTGSPFGKDYMLITVGFLISLAIVIPASVVELVDNIRIQIVSLITLALIIISWLVTFMIHGLDSDRVPLVGTDFSQAVGTVLFNYAFIVMIPSWINDLNPTVSIRKSVWYSISISTCAYILLGFIGGMAYQIDSKSNIIAVINNSSERSIISTITTYLFPLAVLIASIPAYAIIVRYNLINNNYCDKVTATLLSSVLPWVIIIPFQTGSWLNSFMNWTTLIFSTISNFILPFLFYYISQTREHLKSDDDIVPKAEEPIEKAKNLERKLSMSILSDALSIKSVFLKAFSDDDKIVNTIDNNYYNNNNNNNHNNWLPLPIVVSPPSPGLEPKSGNNLNVDDFHLSPSTTPRRRRSRDSNLSRSLDLDSNGGGVNFLVINTSINPKQMDLPIYSSSPKELEPSPFLTIPGGVGGGDICMMNRDKENSSISSESDTKISPSGRHLATSPPSLISRTSFSRRKSLSSPPTIVITPAIAINDIIIGNENNHHHHHNNNNLSADPHCDTHSLSIQSIHTTNSIYTNCPPPSPIMSIYEDIYSSTTQKSSNNLSEIENDLNNLGLNNNSKIGEIFRAFPGLPTRYGLKLAITSGFITIVLVGGILLYDFVCLALGQNVFE